MIGNIPILTPADLQSEWDRGYAAGIAAQAKDSIAMRAELQKVRDWADAKLAAGEEPPWAWFQYMKLREVIDDTLAGMDTVVESASQIETPTGTKLQVVSDSDKPVKVQLPF